MGTKILQKRHVLCGCVGFEVASWNMAAKEHFDIPSDGRIPDHLLAEVTNVVPTNYDVTLKIAKNTQNNFALNSQNLNLKTYLPTFSLVLDCFKNASCFSQKCLACTCLSTGKMFLLSFLQTHVRTEMFHFKLVNVKRKIAQT